MDTTTPLNKRSFSELQIMAADYRRAIDTAKDLKSRMEALGYTALFNQLPDSQITSMSRALGFVNDEIATRPEAQK